MSLPHPPLKVRQAALGKVTDPPKLNKECGFVRYKELGWEVLGTTRQAEVEGKAVGGR